MPLTKRVAQASLLEIKRVKRAARNARIHSAEQLGQIADSITRFGFVNPLLVDERFTLIAGEGRLRAAEMLGMTEIPVIVLEGLSETEAKALALADNRIALNSSWDSDLLRLELEAVADEFEAADLGFTDKEVEAALNPKGLEVEEIATTAVEDTFWISVRGPLVDQAMILKKLQALIAEHPSVELELGTIDVEALPF